MEVEDTKGNLVEVKKRSKKIKEGKKEKKVKEVEEIEEVKEVKEEKTNPTLEHLFMAILFRLDVIEKLLTS